MHRARRVLEVADALVDGDWRVLVPASGSGRSEGQQGAKRRNRWSKCARLTDSVPDDCSESERRYFFNSAGPQRHPRVARAPPPSRADASGGGGARPSRPRDARVHLWSRAHTDFQDQGRRIGGTRSMPAEVMVCYHFADLYLLLAEKIRYMY